MLSHRWRLRCPYWTNIIMQSGYGHSSASRALVRGLRAGGMAGGLPNSSRVFAVRWMNSLAKSPDPAPRKRRNWSMPVRLKKWLWKERSRSVRRSESPLFNGILQQRRAILSIILSSVYIQFDHAYNV